MSYIPITDDSKEEVKKDDFQRYKIVDVDSAEITVSQLIDRYLSDPDSCIIKGYPEFNDAGMRKLPEDK
jgi:hypothetical protein